MNRFSKIARFQPGIIPRLLAASSLAVVIAVAVVQAWTLHIVGQSEYAAAQAQLDVTLGILRHEVEQLGTDWGLNADGQLTRDGQVASGLDKVVKDTGRIAGGVITIFAGDTRMATTVPRPDGSPATGTRLAPGPARDAAIGHGQTYRGMNDILGVRYFTVYEPFRDAAGRQIGILFVGVSQAAVQAILDKILWHSILAGLIVTGAVICIGLLMLRAALQPLRALAGAVNTIGDGQLDVTVPCAGRGDQLGDIGRAVERLRQKAIQAQCTESDAAVERDAKIRQQDSMDLLTRDFAVSVSGVLSGLVESGAGMRTASTDMADAAEYTRSGMSATADAAERSSENLARAATAADALTASAGEISRQAGQAAAASREAVEQALATDTTVRGLSEAAGQIGDVLTLIGSIAGQTNLLALNATIEAARAGDAGKGFAVVASEVKQLATQTSLATRQIGAQVQAIQAATGNAAAAVSKVAAAIGRVSDVANAIAAAVEDQIGATREIAGQVQSVAQAIGEATRAMKDASRTAARSGDTSQSVLAAAGHVSTISETLRSEVDYFLAAMQTSQQSGERRRYERVSGNRTDVLATSPIHGSCRAPLIDISLGGASLSCDWDCGAGTEIAILFPGDTETVPSRATGRTGDGLTVAFRQDPAALLRVVRAMDRIAATAAAA